MVIINMVIIIMEGSSSVFGSDGDTAPNICVLGARNVRWLSFINANCATTGSGERSVITAS